MHYQILIKLFVSSFVLFFNFGAGEGGVHGLHSFERKLFA